MIDFSTLKGLTVPEGVVTKIECGGVILWELQTSRPVVLEVAKITSNTYAGSTTYNNESFILVDIYPKSGGTVTVTYGGLSKTITDDGTSEEPNAQPVFFGTFNGVSDETETPDSGTLTIEGDFRAFGDSFFESSKSKNAHATCITEIIDYGNIEFIPEKAFGGDSAVTTSCTEITNGNIPNGVISVGVKAFLGCTGLTSVTIPASVVRIGAWAFGNTSLTSVVFENPSGWWTAGYSDDTSGDSIDVSDPENNAKLLALETETASRYWNRSA